jgi:hypothetical protein
MDKAFPRQSFSQESAQYPQPLPRPPTHWQEGEQGMPFSPSPSSQSNMVQLCAKLAVDLAINMVNMVPDPVTGAVLKTFLGLLSDELKGHNGKLDELGSKLDKLIEGYYITGYECLEDASRVTDSQREKLIEAALDKFRTA